MLCLTPLQNPSYSPSCQPESWLTITQTAWKQAVNMKGFTKTARLKQTSDGLKAQMRILSDYMTVPGQLCPV
ncbi:hypothetical protein NPIL_524441 [Nephila pilipes]|uniref:Uncharacterized protein n=1 Tax=Nephila pilipes TaxID=299642 RepID=A0A8X6U0A4_NEPPI|nr:hypothetical protein NPIL_524441 [Nephila pilipes]